MTELFCYRCKENHPPKETIQIFGNGTIHVRGECANCGAFIKFIPHCETTIQDPRLNK